jgi:hypothetical protein
MTINLSDIFPLIVPANYYIKGTWELPHYSLPNPSFILTWVIFDSQTSMTYLTPEQYQYLNNNYKDWQQVAIENLRHSINANENFFTQFKMSHDGEKLIFIAFMNADGIGSGRILLSNELSKAFPNGYYLALPDRSCGLVIAKDINVQDFEETKKMIAGMYQNASTAMSDQIHPISDFALPEEWTLPINIPFSQLLISEIEKLRL